MSALKNILEKLSKAKRLRQFKTIFETLEGIFFGVSEVTPGAPHMVDNLEIKRYMSFVIIALLPTAAASIVFFGWQAVKLILVSYIAGGIVEVCFAILMKRHIEEGFLVTGLIFPLVLPASTPIWVAIVGIIFGVFFGKEIFGGTGRNIFNPALVGRLFITIAFPRIMSASWIAPFTDVITSATPLAMMRTAGEVTPFKDLLLGLHGGSMGELFRIGVIAGGLFLMASKVANWRVPVTYLGTVAVFAFIGNRVAPASIAPPVFQLLSGGLLYGAFFMATDPVTSPSTRAGKLVFGVLCGILTIIIRSFSGYTEGVMFSIIFMNALSPLIDHLVLKRKYRVVKQ